MKSGKGAPDWFFGDFFMLKAKGGNTVNQQVVAGDKIGKCAGVGDLF